MRLSQAIILAFIGSVAAYTDEATIFQRSGYDYLDDFPYILHDNYIMARDLYLQPRVPIKFRIEKKLATITGVLGKKKKKQETEGSRDFAAITSLLRKEKKAGPAYKESQKTNPDLPNLSAMAAKQAKRITGFDEKTFKKAQRANKKARIWNHQYRDAAEQAFHRKMIWDNKFKLPTTMAVIAAGVLGPVITSFSGVGALTRRGIHDDELDLHIREAFDEEFDDYDW